KYSEHPSEWFLQKLGAGESYTDPETVYLMAKERGMTFVTITDHNEIEGSLLLAQKYPDAFPGVETTTYFPEDGCKVHLLIYGLDHKQFDRIQKIRRNIYDLREYVIDRKLAHSVAHGTYSVNRKLTYSHLERLAVLFDVFEGINGARNRTSNLTWLNYLNNLTREAIGELAKRYGITPQRKDSHKKGFTGGSDDHAAINIARTYTFAAGKTIEDFLANLQERQSIADGRVNDFQSLVFSIYKTAHEFSTSKGKRLISSIPLTNFMDLIFGERRVSLKDRFDLALLKADPSNNYQRSIAELVEEINANKISSIEENLDLLYDRIADIVDEVLVNLIDTSLTDMKEGDPFTILGKISSALPGLFLLVPFFSSFRHLNSNQQLLKKLNAKTPTQPTRKILWFTDTLNDLNGPSVTLKQLGWQFYHKKLDVRIVSSLLPDEITDDLPPTIINLPSISTFPLPYYSTYTMKVPSLLKSLKAIQDFEPDEIFISTPGPVGFFGILAAKLLSIPMVGIYHTDYTAELSEITTDDSSLKMVEASTKWFYTIMDEIRVPTQSYIDILAERGLDPKKMKVFPRQIDHDVFSFRPPNGQDDLKLKLPEGLNLLYAGRVSKDKNLEFLVDLYQELRKTCSNINLIVAGDGPYLNEMKETLGGNRRVVFTGRLPYLKLPCVYSQADFFVFPSTTDTYGMVVLEAQSCELPTIVSNVGGPQDIIIDGETGFVLPALKLKPWVEKIIQLDELVKGDAEKYHTMRKRARQHATAISGWEVVMKDLLRLELPVLDSQQAD
ncbi:MAG: glycosyltransferase, partial [bacterium]